MRFNFVGEIGINGEDAKVPGFRTIKSEKADGLNMNVTVISEVNNRAFVEMTGFKNKIIKTSDSEGNKIDISWDDRFDSDVVKSVANFKKSVITLNGDRHEFITKYDFIEFVRDHIDDIKGKEFTVTGQIEKNEYNGKIKDRFQIQNMFEVTEEKKHQLKVYGEFFYNTEGIDTADWKSERKITFNGYTKEWMSKDHPSVYCERTIVFDCSRLDFNKEKHVALANYRLKQMGLALEDGKIKVNLKKNTYYCQSVILSYVNGAEKIEFDESQLTDNQKEGIALGIKSLDDFRPSGSIYGDRVVIYKLIDFDSRDKFADGCVKCDETVKEFEENIYVISDTDSLDDFEAAMNKPVEDDGEISEEDLFR